MPEDLPAPRSVPHLGATSWSLVGCVGTGRGVQGDGCCGCQVKEMLVYKRVAVRSAFVGEGEFQDLDIDERERERERERVGVGTVGDKINYYMERSEAYI